MIRHIMAIARRGSLAVVLVCFASCQRAEESPQGGAAPAAAVAEGPRAESASAAEANDETALAIFNRRILPILDAPNASSCAECHLSGVDLKDYIRRDQSQTFAALRAAGLIDLEKPDDSKLLKFIARRPERPSLLTDAARQEELSAFRAWIRAAARDESLLAANDAAAPAGPSVPLEVVRHARRDRVLASFLENVWAEVGRCAACHSPDRNQQQVAEHGEQVSWIVLDDPQATLDHLLAADLIDRAAPDQSLLLLKPTLAVEHGGGQKLVVGDRTYRQFRRFIDDYAATAAGRYATAVDLPPPLAELSQATDVWLKLTDVPAAFDKLLLQVDVHRWLEEQGQWSPARWATGDRQIYGEGNLWQQHLSLTAPRDAATERQLSAGRLPPGRYLLKIYLDREGRSQSLYPYELGERELVGQVEIDATWPAGYGAMTAAAFPH